MTAGTDSPILQIKLADCQRFAYEHGCFDFLRRLMRRRATCRCHCNLPRRRRYCSIVILASFHRPWSLAMAGRGSVMMADRTSAPAIFSRLSALTKRGIVSALQQLAILRHDLLPRPRLVASCYGKQHFQMRELCGDCWLARSPAFQYVLYFPTAAILLALGNETAVLLAAERERAQPDAAKKLYLHLSHPGASALMS